MTEKDFSPLDSPIWNALHSGHAHMAHVKGDAVRYPADVSPFAALREPTIEAFADLAELIDGNGTVAMATAWPITPPTGWIVRMEGILEQMVCVAPPPPSAMTFAPLGDADVEEMLALTAMTEPGPFLPRTITTGPYFGMRSDTGRLMAMAGQRMSLGEFTEISAVCTHPEFRGQGLAKSLVSGLARMILADGKVPFLHVKAENGAKLVYEKLGFAVRAPIHLSVILPQR